MKRQDEQGYCDVCKYRPIFYLSDYIYVYICLSAVLLCLSVYLSKSLYLCPPNHCADWDIHLGSNCWS
jgi:hypothetical protein